jgi:hypothetical protein
LPVEIHKDVIDTDNRIPLGQKLIVVAIEVFNPHVAPESVAGANVNLTPLEPLEPFNIDLCGDCAFAMPQFPITVT